MKELGMNAEIHKPEEDYYDTTSLEPVSPLSSTPVRSTRPEKPRQEPLTHRTKFWMWVVIALVVILVFFTPVRINVLLLGIDPTHNDTFQGRSDTMILTTVPPFSPFMHMLSIPRDLYVDVPGHYQNRINTAHFFAEVEKEGSGPAAAAQAVEVNFHVSVPFTVSIKTDGFKNIVDAMGGVTVNLPFDMSGMTAGEHTLDSTQALRFVRDRTGSDDFYRQLRGQIFLKAAAGKMLNPINWWRIPKVIAAVSSSVRTNVPVFLWPRLGYSLAFSALKGFDMHSLDRTMVQNWVTPEGGQVLLPLWDQINPLVNQLFR
jgi:LCP family protein required for cell wall assembly